MRRITLLVGLFTAGIFVGGAISYAPGQLIGAQSCTQQSDCARGDVCVSGACDPATADLYSFSDEIYASSQAFLDELKARQLNVVTAESLTSGMIVSSLVDVPLYGAYIYGGFATYDSDAKRQFLGVKVGDVYTKECSLEMAIGALMNSRALVALAVTGKAGPVAKTDLQNLGVVDIGFSIRTDQTLPGSDLPSDSSFPQTFTSRSKRINACGQDGHPETRAICDKYRIEAAANDAGQVSLGVLNLVRKLIRQDTVLNAVRFGAQQLESYPCPNANETIVCPHLGSVCPAPYDGDYAPYGEPSSVIDSHIGDGTGPCRSPGR